MKKVIFNLLSTTLVLLAMLANDATAQKNYCIAVQTSCNAIIGMNTTVDVQLDWSSIPPPNGRCESQEIYIMAEVNGGSTYTVVTNYNLVNGYGTANFSWLVPLDCTLKNKTVTFVASSAQGIDGYNISGQARIAGPDCR